MMRVIWRILRSKMILAWALVIHGLVQPWKRWRGQVTTLPRWLGWLGREHVGVTPGSMWQLSAQASRCLGCGACNSVGLPHEQPAQWIMANARQPQDAHLLQQRAARLRQLAPEITAVCPAHVNAVHVAEWIEAHARAYGDVDTASRPHPNLLPP